MSTVGSRQPPAAEVERLAQDWVTTSVHEFGHAVVGLAEGVQIHEVWLDYQRVWGDWRVVGRTEVGRRRGGTVVLGPDTIIRMSIAGPEAEAIHIADRDRIQIGRASCRERV